jgi:hypothetical protein
MAGKNRKIRGVYFNAETESHLLGIADEMPNFSAWVKGHLKHYRPGEPLQTPGQAAAQPIEWDQIKDYVERLMQTKMADRAIAAADQAPPVDDFELNVDQFFKVEH